MKRNPHIHWRDFTRHTFQLGRLRPLDKANICDFVAVVIAQQTEFIGKCGWKQNAERYFHHYRLDDSKDRPAVMEPASGGSFIVRDLSKKILWISLRGDSKTFMRSPEFRTSCERRSFEKWDQGDGNNLDCTWILCGLAHRTCKMALELKIVFNSLTQSAKRSDLLLGNIHTPRRLSTKFFLAL